MAPPLTAALLLLKNVVFKKCMLELVECIPPPDSSEMLFDIRVKTLAILLLNFSSVVVLMADDRRTSAPPVFAVLPENTTSVPPSAAVERRK